MRTRDEAGVAFPSPLVILSIIAIAMAGVAFFLTGNDDGGEVRVVSDPETSASASPSPTPETKTKPQPTKKKPVVKRGDTYVEVYNNSGQSGLAGRTAGEVSGRGWQVVATDNWYGSIPATTVYFGPRLKQAAQMLAKDLGIERVLPAVDPMRGDRLTVILTTDYQG